MGRLPRFGSKRGSQTSINQLQPAASHSSTTGRNLALDGLRGLAVILVTLSHDNVVALRYGGIAGVTLFFVLSGYLITTLIVTEQRQTGRVALGAFYMRRALRLLPALVVVLVAGTILASVLGTEVAVRGIPTGTDPATGNVVVGALVALFYVANLAIPFGWPIGPFGAFWSLSLEEQYYALWPLLIVGFRRFGARRLIAFALLLAGVSLVLRFRGDPTTVEGYLDSYYLPWTNVWAPLLGSALGLALVEWPRIHLPRWCSWVALAVIVVGISSVLGFRTGWHEHLVPVTLVLKLAAGPVVALFGLLLVLDAATNAVSWRWLTHPVMLFFGRISYALYLWHTVLDHVIGGRLGFSGVRGMVVGLFVTTPLAVGAAMLSGRLVEQPFMRMKKRFERARAPIEDELSAFASPDPQ
jgi:peptidoglycan/LPS O-acetylase OafA/YrhL